MQLSNLNTAAAATQQAVAHAHHHHARMAHAISQAMPRKVHHFHHNSHFPKPPPP